MISHADGSCGFTVNFMSGNRLKGRGKDSLELFEIGNGKEGKISNYSDFDPCLKKRVGKYYLYNKAGMPN